jgi:hypothetical protein
MLANWVWTAVGNVTWGCRAILDKRGPKPYLDILHDRQSWCGGTEEERAEASKKINNALPTFRKDVERGAVPGASEIGERVIRGITFKYHYRGGYLWVAAGEAS